MFTYKYDPEHLPYMKEQIWEMSEGHSVYDLTSEYEYEWKKKYIPKKPKVILDIGCGLGRFSIYLNSKIPGAYHILADRTGYTENTGQFNPEEDEYYNDLRLTESFARLNGLENFQTFDTELGDWSSLPKVDFINSSYSLGFHVKIERYMEKMLSISSPRVVMVFGLSNGAAYTEDTFSDLFENSFMVCPQREDPLPYQRLLVLSNPK